MKTEYNSKYLVGNGLKLYDYVYIVRMCVPAAYI